MTDPACRSRSGLGPINSTRLDSTRLDAAGHGTTRQADGSTTARCRTTSPQAAVSRRRRLVRFVLEAVGVRRRSPGRVRDAADSSHTSSLELVRPFVPGRRRQGPVQRLVRRTRRRCPLDCRRSPRRLPVPNRLRRSSPSRTHHRTCGGGAGCRRRRRRRRIERDRF